MIEKESQILYNQSTDIQIEANKIMQEKGIELLNDYIDTMLKKERKNMVSFLIADEKVEDIHGRGYNRKS